MAYRKNPVSQDELRKLAQGRTAIQLGADVTTLEPAEVKRLLEDLEVHQIALEHQNEHLSVAREQLETALSQSCELYDFSPVGSLVLDSKEDITKMNLAAASLLGSERARLLGNRLGLFIVEADRHEFNYLLKQAQNSRDVQVGEIELLGKNGLTVHVQLRVSRAVGKGSNPCARVRSGGSSRLRQLATAFGIGMCARVGSRSARSWQSSMATLNRSTAAG